MNRRSLLLAVAVSAAVGATGLAACKPKTKAAATNPAADALYLVNNGKQPGVTTTASGLEYKVLTSGPADGPHPQPNDEVKVNYEGRLIPKDGKPSPDDIFDSSYQRGAPDIFTVNQVVPGWTEALQLMRPGDVWELAIPARLAYGDEGAGGKIPPGATLLFKVELLGVLAHPGLPGAK
jgi:peptidylprolyl isomerase/FKBP-type peptidyl-prolyl cis-trans isomerase FklB